MGFSRKNGVRILEGSIGVNMEWISVKDKKPPYCEYVLVTDGKIVYEAKVRGADFLESDRFGFGEDDYDDEITHWMPLPKPPKNESP